MPELNDLLKETGDDALDMAKKSFKELLSGAKNNSEEVIKETGDKVEKWAEMWARGEIDDDELEALLNARRRTVRQFLNTQEIAGRAQLEQVSLGLIDLVSNKFIGVLS